MRHLKHRFQLGRKKEHRIALMSNPDHTPEGKGPAPIHRKNHHLGQEG
jgi:hypothetical protein